MKDNLYLLEMNNGSPLKYVKLERVGLIHPSLMDIFKRNIRYNFYGWNSDGPYQWSIVGEYATTDYVSRENIDAFMFRMDEQYERYAGGFEFHRKINIESLCSMIKSRDTKHE